MEYGITQIGLPGINWDAGNANWATEIQIGLRKCELDDGAQIGLRIMQIRLQNELDYGMQIGLRGIQLRWGANWGTNRTTEMQIGLRNTNWIAKMRIGIRDADWITECKLDYGMQIGLRKMQIGLRKIQIGLQV